MGWRQRRAWQRGREVERDTGSRGGKGERGQREENIRKKRESWRGTKSQRQTRVREENPRESGAKVGQGQTAVHTQTGRKAGGGAQAFYRVQLHPRPRGSPPQPGGWPTWLVSDDVQHSGLALVPDGLQRDSGSHRGGGPRRTPGPPRAQHCAHHVRVGPVGQPQRLQEELLLELGLLGVQDHELLADLPTMCPQALILGVLGAGAGGVSPGKGRGPSNQSDLEPCWQNLCGGHSLSLWPDMLNFLLGNSLPSPHHHVACPEGHDSGLAYQNIPWPWPQRQAQRQAHDPSPRTTGAAVRGVAPFARHPGSPFSKGRKLVWE